MRLHHTSLVAALFFVVSVSPGAQTNADPSGHWEGAIRVPGMDVTIEVDLERAATGEFAATFANPAQNIKGFPLSEVSVAGSAISFRLDANQGGTFTGALAADGTSMSGDFNTTTEQGSVSIPFNLTRTGPARIEAVPRSAAIARELEGTWNGTLDVDGRSMRLVLEMSNRPDGTSVATLANLDQGGAEIPIATITQNAATLTLDVKVVSGRYTGTLNRERTELSGTWTQRGFSAPLVFRHSQAGVKK